MRRAVRKARLRPLLLSALLLWGAAGAQLEFSQLNLFGRSVPSIRLYGAEYARDDVLSASWRIARAGEIVSVEGFGHLILLPLDLDQQRATTSFNTVQIDTERRSAATATLVNGHLYLPLSTLSAAIGASYAPGSLRLDPPRVLSVSSRAGPQSDRIVLDLNRDAEVQASVSGNSLEVRLAGASGPNQSYGTRGVYLPQVRLTNGPGGLTLSAHLNAGWGYRSYKVQRPGGTRLVLDVGPGVSSVVPALFGQLRKPLIVLDPQDSPNAGGDAPLEVARAVGELLSKAGWQVQLTRNASGSVSLEGRQQLARRSDLFLSLGVERFPGARASGVTLSEPGGNASAEIINAIRALDTRDPLLRAAVSNAGDNRSLSELIRGELSALDLKPRSGSGQNLLLLREAPRAALSLELGWPQDSRDRARLSDPGQTQALAVALARGVATYLAARANRVGGP